MVFVYSLTDKRGRPNKKDKKEREKVKALGLIRAVEKKDCLEDEEIRVEKERGRRVSSATLKERIRVLPLLYKRVWTLLKRIEDSDSIQSKVLEAIEAKSNRIIEGKGDIEGEGNEYKDEVKLSEIFQFYLEYQKSINESLEVCRKFLIYFPLELNLQQRRLLIYYNALNDVQKSRFMEMLERVLGGKLKLSAPGRNNFNKSVKALLDVDNYGGEVEDDKKEE